MGDGEFLPPGHHPRDQARPTKEPVDFQLERLDTFLRWSMEHYLMYRKTREKEPRRAEEELGYLEDSLRRANGHFRRLEDLLRHGYAASPAPTVDEGGP